MTNPGARQLAIGGICEDAIMSMLSGISAFGSHIGAGSSYGAFSAPLGHIAARLHAIGNQARVTSEGGAYRPFFLICAHAGLKTGEDGPTHADPQALQLLQDNFPLGTMITLTPWDPQEIWFLVSAALAKRPAIIAPFVTRPPETVLDRAALGLPSAALAAQGVYRLRYAHGQSQGTIVLQGTGVMNAFVNETLPLLDNAGLGLNVYVITSSELFDLLPPAERARDLSRSASTGSDGHHRFHIRDHDSLDSFRLWPKAFTASVQSQSFSWKRIRCRGDEGSRSGRQESIRSDPRLRSGSLKESCMSEAVAMPLECQPVNRATRNSQ